MGNANQAYESVFDYRARDLVSMVAAAALLTAGAVANAQTGPEFAYDACEFLPASSGTEDPDYSVVDAMIEAPLGLNGRVEGARRYLDPICISQSPSKLTWLEQRPVNTRATDDPLHVVRRAFFYKPRNSTRMRLPLIIWAHPAETADVVEDTDYARIEIAQAATDHGFAFLSVQFRHPTRSQVGYAAPPGPPDQDHNGNPPPAEAVMRPATDIATAVQWARANANRLYIWPEDIFIVSQSRGSLAVLTALMPNQKVPGATNPPWAKESSLPKAVFAAQAQSTYRDDQVKSFFLKNFATQTVTNRITTKELQFPLCRQDSIPPVSGPFNYWCQYDLATQDFQTTVTTPLSAVDELQPSDEPPIWMRYESMPLSLTTVQPVGLYVNGKGEYQEKTSVPENCYETTNVNEAPRKCFQVHHPHFGLKLRLKWLGFPVVGRKSYVYVEYANTQNAAQREAAAARLVKNYYCFFMEYETADGVVHEQLSEPAETARMTSVIEENNSRLPPDKIDPNQCRLSELQPWTGN
jgi:hypothetical protein